MSVQAPEQTGTATVNASVTLRPPAGEDITWQDFLYRARCLLLGASASVRLRYPLVYGMDGEIPTITARCEADIPGAGPLALDIAERDGHITTVTARFVEKAARDVGFPVDATCDHAVLQQLHAAAA